MARIGFVKAPAIHGSLTPIFRWVALFLTLALAGCVGSSYKSSSRYEQRYDSAPIGVRDLAKVPNAVPRVEPRSRRGNKSPYTVRGKTYSLLPTALGYESVGTASWYGAKFHGHLTSNGETYNMFEMSAAHKSLPIPTYLEVENLLNGRKVIVRVNDRGPFHQGRIVDLSYAAAAKLGFVEQGTAQVRIRAIDPIAWNRQQQGDPASGSIYLQVGAFTNPDSANRLMEQLKNITNLSVRVKEDRVEHPGLHKVHVGPFADIVAAERERNKISIAGLGAPLIITLPKS